MAVSIIQKSDNLENVMKTVPVLYSHSLAIYFGLEFNIAQHNTLLNISGNQIYIKIKQHTQHGTISTIKTVTFLYFCVYK